MTTVSDIVLTSPNTLTQFFDNNDVNHVVDQLYQNLRKISQLVSTNRIGQGLFAFDAPIDPACQVGQPVFYNTTTNRFERSKIQLLSAVTGRTYASDSSEAWGLVSVKCAADRAHILLDGLATISLLQSTGSSSPTGKFYLTSVSGQLSTSITSALVAPVLLALGNGDVLFRPWFADNFPRFTPAQVTLLTTPAGTATVSGNVSQITAASASTLGWLPAGHAVFGGTAPLNAKFGYNWKQDAQLSVGWPPINPASAKIYLDVGGANNPGSEVLISGDQRVIINSAGIWWMQDTVGQTPWTLPAVGATAGTRPFPYAKKMYLDTDLTVQGTSLTNGVTSLSTAIPWLAVYGKGTSNAAKIGDVELAVDTTKLYDATVTNDDGVAIKGVDTTGKFITGPVVSSLVSDSASITLSGQQNTQGNFVGPVRLAFSGSKEYDLLPTDIQLINATTESYGTLMALGLPPARSSSFVAAFHVPNSVPSGSKIKFILWFSGSQTYTIPATIVLSTRTFTRPTSGSVSVPSEVPISFPIPTGTSVPVNKYLELSSVELTVTGGSTIYVRVARNGTADTLATEVHILKIYAAFTN